MTSLPLAYLITFRTYGTWLHGNQRGSVDHFHNQYGSPLFPPNEARQQQANAQLTLPPVVLNVQQRQSVELAVRETCNMRAWPLHALNARTNHVHAVVSADAKPEPILNALKANSTRQLRLNGRWQHSRSPWSDGGSRRYIWTEAGLQRAVDYVLNGQDGPLPELK